MHHIYNFFETVNYYYGSESTKLLKLWIKYRKAIINNKLKLAFLRNCQKNNIFPQHIDCQLIRFENNFRNHNTIHKFKSSRKRFLKRLLRLEIGELYYNIQITHEKIFKISQEIDHNIPINIYVSFFNNQAGPLYSYFLKEGEKLDRKFKFLLSKQKRELHIKPIHYYYQQLNIKEDDINIPQQHYYFFNNNDQQVNKNIDNEIYI